MRTVDALNGITDYWTDASGNALGLRDAKGSLTTGRYNALGHRVASNDPNQGAWTFSSNALGELLTQTDARGVITKVEARDGLGRVLRQSSAPSPLPVGLANEHILDTWQYDPSAAKGQLAWVQRQTSSSPITPATTVAWKESYDYTGDTTRLYQRTTQIAAVRRWCPTWSRVTSTTRTTAGGYSAHEKPLFRTHGKPAFRLMGSRDSGAWEASVGCRLSVVVEV